MMDVGVRIYIARRQIRVRIEPIDVIAGLFMVYVRVGVRSRPRSQRTVEGYRVRSRVRLDLIIVLGSSTFKYLIAFGHWCVAAIAEWIYREQCLGIEIPA